MSPTAAPPRFFRLFDVEPPAFDTGFLLALGEAMGRDRMERVPLNVPSGYVYLGQFLAHDLTHQQGGIDVPDPDPRPTAALVQLAEPTLELDCVYGPAGAAQAPDNPALALAGGRFRLGSARDGARVVPGADLPRDPVTREALIADFRNDENLLIGQLHLQFLKIHNLFVDRLQAQAPHAGEAAWFAAARQQTILHYQRIIHSEWLATLLDRRVWQHVIRDDARDDGMLWDMTAHSRPDMPVEFAFGAMRFGHSMVLPSYNITMRQTLKLEDAFLMTGRGGFAGLGQLPASHVVDWSLFFRDPALPRGALMNFGLRISDAVVLTVPSHVAAGDGRHFHRMAKRNLVRARAAQVPSGQQVAELLLSRHGSLCRAIGLDGQYLATTAAALQAGRNPVLASALSACGRHDSGTVEVPLWYYVLIEAHAHNGELCDGRPDNWGRLGKVGSLIIAEAVRALTWLGDISVYRSEPAQFAGLARRGSHATGKGGRVDYSTMADLIAAASASA